MSAFDVLRSGFYTRNWKTGSENIERKQTELMESQAAMERHDELLTRYILDLVLVWKQGKVAEAKE